MNDPATTAERLEYFAGRFNTVWAHFFCLLEFEGDDDIADDSLQNSRSWMLRTIQNGCLNATLLAIRDLDDFFDPRPKQRPDDLRATDFGYRIGRGFLTPAEREDINKLIAHSTTRAAHTPARRWPIWVLADKCANACLAFLEWAQAEFGADAGCLMVVVGTRTHLNSVYTTLAKEVSRRHSAGP